MPSTSDFHCHDCNAEYDQEHHPGCDMEWCPICNGQMIFGCGCGGSNEAIEDIFGNVIYLHFGAEPDQAKFIEDLMVENSLNSYDLLYSDVEWSESKTRINVDYSGDITEVDLGNLGISIIPTSIKYLNKLKVLNLENNQINEPPESINNLISLKELNLYGNPLTNNPNSTTKALLKLLRVRNINMKKTFFLSGIFTYSLLTN